MMENLKTHVNVPNMKGEVYCHLTGGKVSFRKEDMEKTRHQCFNCKFFGGTAQGQGVECVYADPSKKE